MALGAGEFTVILVEGKAGHGSVVKAQVLPFPAFAAVAFGTVGAEHSFVGVISLVTGFAVVIRPSG